jgi:methylenetetrahydrofolate dehydrogenase (NADP+)/methenyltetrahydrofolate cyclohydrolase
LAKLLEGKPLAERIKEQLRQEVQSLKNKPLLASILVGENAGAEAYVKSQAKTAENLGVVYQLHKLAADTTESGLFEFIQKLNSDQGTSGIIVQMPLPAQIDYKKISQFILPDKDVEGIHPANIGKILFGKAVLLPCTPAAVMELLKETGLDLYGKETVIVGHSEIVGKPLALLLLEQFATVTVCHIGTSQAGRLEEHVRKAEVLIVAVGKANLISGEWIKSGAVVIDVGINRIEGKIVGDVEFTEAQKRVSYITPVPGGVGPLTVTMLMRNLIEAAKLQERNTKLSKE